MAFSTGAVYLPFLDTQLTSPFVDFDNDTIKVMLVTSGYTFSASHQYRSSATAFETSGTNYVAGGQTVSGVIVSTSGDNVIVNGGDNSWAGASSAPFTFRGAVIYKDTGNPATDPLISFHDFGSDLNNSGLNVILQWSITPLLVYNTVSVPVQLSDLSDVDSATPTNRYVLVANGTEWSARALTEADISDLQAYITTETNDLTSAVTWANVPDANITQSSVTQHQAALTIVESQISDLGAYLENVSEDLTPQLGGNLDVNNFEIVSATNGDIIINPDGVGNIGLGNYTFDGDQTVGLGQDNYVLTYDHASGLISLEATAPTVTQLSDLSDVNTSTPTNRNVLVADGLDWESRALVEADISDLQAYLTTETNDLTAAVVWANVPDANITQTSVTQHQAALSITESQISDLQSYLLNVVEDLTPQLGANLDVQGFTITTSTLNGDISLDPDGTGNVILGNYALDGDQTVGLGQDNYILTYDNGTGLISLEAPPSTVTQLSDLTDVNTSTPTNRNVLVADGVDWESRALVEADISDLGTYLENVVEDTTPQLGGNLDANGFEIQGTGLTISSNDTNLTLQHTAVGGGGGFIFSSNSISEYTKLTQGGTNATWELFGTDQQEWRFLHDNSTYGSKMVLDNCVSSTLGVASLNIPRSTQNPQLANRAIGDIWQNTSNDLVFWDGTTIQVLNGLTNVVEDTTPQLGGTLDANGNTIDMGVNIITDTKVGNWDTAFSWGDHALAGYLTSFTETNDLTAAVTWANVPNANITQSSVTQHQAALSITESQISDLGAYLENVVEDTTPQLGGNLDTNGFDITGNSGANYIDLNGAGNALQYVVPAATGIQQFYVGTAGGTDDLRLLLDEGGVDIYGSPVIIAKDETNTTPGGKIQLGNDFVGTQRGSIDVGGTGSMNFQLEDAATTGIYSFKSAGTATQNWLQVHEANTSGTDYLRLRHDGTKGIIDVSDFNLTIDGQVGLLSLESDSELEILNTNATNGVVIGTNNTNAYMNVSASASAVTLTNGAGDFIFDPTGDNIFSTGGAGQDNIFRGADNRFENPTATVGPAGFQIGSDGATTPARAEFNTDSQGNLVIQLLDDNIGSAAGPAFILQGPAGGDFDGLEIASNTGTGLITISHDDTNGTISTSAGDLILDPTGTNNVLLGTLEFNADTTVGATQDGYALIYDNTAGEIDLSPLGTVLLSEGVASNVAALNFTDLTSEFQRYQLIIHNTTPVTDGADLNMQVSIDNGATYVTTASYHWTLGYDRIRSTGGSASGNEGVWGDTVMEIESNLGTGTGEELAGIIDIFDPLGTDDYTRIQTRTTSLSAQPEIRTTSAAGQYNATTAVNAFRLIMSTGNINTCSYQLFGYR